MQSPQQVSWPTWAALEGLYAQQRAAFAGDSYPSLAARDARLARLAGLLREHAAALAAAVSRDFGNRSVHETQLLELFPTLQAIRHARRHLRTWMRPARRGVTVWFKPGRARIESQPLGVVGIIAPWNYPISLAIEPLAGALAAGNRAMVKLSEFAPATSALLAELVAATFAPAEVAVVQGDATVAGAFARLPFDHLLFTGSTRVGASVMRAAADLLTPVTLELGGKSPALVAPDYPLPHAVARILAGKCLNAGQTCIAPDYALVPAERVDEFVALARQEFAASYPDWRTTPDYTSVVNARHFERLIGYLEDARAKGAVIVPLAAGEPDRESRRIPATILLNVRDGMQVMRDEIFGPLLPLVPYRDLGEAIAYINARPRPLSLCCFDRNRARTERVLRETVSGGVTVNDALLHYAQPGLPFGGVGPSGMGRYHGREGFDAFSHRKAVFVQSRWNGMALFKPPYGRRFEAIVRLLLR
jgi:coniferyl-aldehyde dehydrogenase